GHHEERRLAMGDFALVSLAQAAAEGPDPDLLDEAEPYLRRLAQEWADAGNAHRLTANRLNGLELCYRRAALAGDRDELRRVFQQYLDVMSASNRTRFFAAAENQELLRHNIIGLWQTARALAETAEGGPAPELDEVYPRIGVPLERTPRHPGLWIE